MPWHGRETENSGESIWIDRRQFSPEAVKQFLNSPVRHQLVDGIADAEATRQLARRRCLTNQLKVYSLQASALGRQADITDGWRHFRYVPIRDFRSLVLNFDLNQ